MGKAAMLLKKATTICKSKSSLLASRVLVLAALQRRRMAGVSVISHKIHALVVADRESVYCRKDLVMREVENRPAVVHGCGTAVELSHQLALFDQENDHGCWPDSRFMHPLFYDDVDDNCCYTDDCDVLLDACNADDAGEDENEEEPSVMDVIRSKRELEGVEFNVEEEIDQAADMFIRRFRQRLNNGF